MDFSPELSFSHFSLLPEQQEQQQQQRRRRTTQQISVYVRTKKRSCIHWRLFFGHLSISRTNPIAHTGSSLFPIPSFFRSDANIVSWTMPDAAKYALEHELEKLNWEDKDHIESTKTFIHEAKQIVQSHMVDVDPHFQQLLLDLAEESSPIEALVLDNLPMDRYIPPTPTDGSIRLNKPSFVAEAVLVAVGELAGTYTVGYKAEKEYSNPWVHEGFPRPSGPASALTAKDQVALHQDMSYQGIIPDLLGLVCLREGADKFVQTSLVSIERLIQILPENVVSILRQPRFLIQASGWVDTNQVDISKMRPILDGKSLHLPVHWTNMVGGDPDATMAVETLQSTLAELNPSGLHLTDGVMVLFNNQKVVHGRTPYTNLKYDGTDRVVFRSYFVKHLEGEAKESRML
jgi:L-asparagine oxygenase